MRRAVLSRTFLTRSLLTRTLALVALAASAVACDDPGPTAPTDTSPVAETFTETFTGVLSRNGAITFPFTAAAAGSASASLAAIGPDNTIALGFAMGTWNGQSCHLVISNDNALEFTTITGSIGSAGQLCLRISDVGRIATTATFTLTVTHP